MKKGIELSLNFIVTIIIALTIFVFGVRFIYNFASEATELEDLTTAELDNRIGELLCESTDRVCIGIDKKTIPRGKFGVFGVKIINIQQTQIFEIIVGRPDPGGYTQDNTLITGDGLDWKPKEPRELTIERNEEKEVGFGISVPRDAKPGIYIFDIKVQSSDASYDTLHKIYVEVP
ncbi:hypothetical protein JYT91_01025 [archaeon AH-315-M20]|nr:hypothetical protein [archaeon AH-315-M20]